MKKQSLKTLLYTGGLKVVTALNDKYSADYNSLLDCLKAQGGSYDHQLIKRAFEYCVTMHAGQKRWTNEEYYIHPLSVAKIVISMGLDSQSVAACLLHDVVEDTKATVDDIKQRFGEEVALLVDGVTRIGRISISSKEQEQAESLRKMLIAMGKDIRVIIIKLADRLHNMRTLDAIPESKQREKSLETLEIYAPIAHRLGIRPLKEELEDLAIKHLDPIAYSEIEESLIVRKAQRESILNDIKDRIEVRLKEEMPGIGMQFQGRVKSIYGIYRKMYLQNRSLDEIYDIYAIRIITDTVTDCYNILGIMHDMFRPIPNRFKDYISTPKPNMYQSLHTTVISREGVPFEIQIRTAEMHHTAEYGIAAHWKYKEGINGNDQSLEQRLAWIRQILEAGEVSGDNSELVRSIKVDLSQEDVFAVTPKGDVINLPVGSTVVDFAFAIHSAVGVKMIGAKADGKIVPLNHEIKTGEVIEILTTSQPGHGPSRDWMNIAVTNSAKTKIRSWFKKEKREENIETGKSELEKELRRSGIEFTEKEFSDMTAELSRRMHYSEPDEFFSAIGYGGILISKIMPRIREDYNRRKNVSSVPAIPETAERVSASSEGVVVDGIDNCLIRLSRCCSPLPGDDIIGFITRGHGVSIHKRDCNNVPVDLSKASEPERWIPAHWDNAKREHFISAIRIYSVDRDGLLADIMGVAYNMRLSVHSMNARKTSGGNCVISITINAESVEHLKSIISQIEKVNGVYSVERVIK
ncbi:MAG: bifunctional (p)ppGpp synthetase/guanosine-3',5'-bis(diphosphate) 3'-pyrophosphohydrolase [Clostridia bacterium]|nr:bifunctional (p)ppGpp synthetase/guanosine-3',5'-bis(diphosphate) 3'-pyrophosphohydrolase [Clostridia bacterium]